MRDCIRLWRVGRASDPPPLARQRLFHGLDRCTVYTVVSGHRYTSQKCSAQWISGCETALREYHTYRMETCHICTCSYVGESAVVRGDSDSD